MLAFFILIGITGLGRGSSFLFIYLGIEQMHPVSVITFRLIFAGIIAVLYLIYTRELGNLVSRRYVLAGGVLSLFGLLIPFYLIAYAELSVETSIAGVLTAGVPLITSLILTVIFKEKQKSLLGMLIGLFGVWLIYAGAGVERVPTYNMHLLFVVLSLLCYATHNIIVSRITEINKRSLACVSMVYAALYSVIVHFLVTPWNTTLNAHNLVVTATLGVFCTAVPLIALFIAIDRFGSVKGSYGAYIIPIVAIMLGFLVLGETVTLIQLLGAFLILGSIYVQAIKEQLGSGRIKHQN